MLFIFPVMLVAIPVAFSINAADQQEYKRQQQLPGGAVCKQQAEQFATTRPTFSEMDRSILERQEFERCMAARVQEQLR